MTRWSMNRWPVWRSDLDCWTGSRSESVSHNHELPASYPSHKQKRLASLQAVDLIGVPTGIRTPVTAVKVRIGGSFS